MNSAILILTLHFIGDFLFQTDWMAKNKSKRNEVLLVHVLVYCLPLFLLGWKFALMSASLHFWVDFVTSRVTSKLWAKGKTHWFFVVIGFDQLLHAICLLKLYEVLL